MLYAMSVFTRSIDERIGWKRIGIAVNILVIAAAFFILFRLLRNIDVDKVLAAIQAMSLQTVLLAILFVAIGYVTLTFYDFFALRTIGQNQVPYRIAALASFTSYTIGHNLGGTVFTGGAVRLRIYSAWGLGIIDVAKIAFVTGLTFWFGKFVGPRRCHGLRARCGQRREPGAALGQSGDRNRGARLHCRLHVVAVAATACHRPQQLAGDAAQCAADLRPDRHRVPRPRGRRARHVHIASQRASHRCLRS